MATNWYEYLIKYEKLMQQCLVTCAINTLKNVYNSFHAEGFPRPFLQIDAELQDVNVCMIFLSVLNFFINSIYLFELVCAESKQTVCTIMLEIYFC